MPNRPSSPYDRMPLKAVVGLMLMGGTGLMLTLITMSEAYLHAVAIGSGAGGLLGFALWIVARRCGGNAQAPHVVPGMARVIPSAPPNFDPERFLEAARERAGAIEHHPRRMIEDKRVAKLKALSQHPETPVKERDAAKDAMERLARQKRRKPRKA